MQVDAHVTVGGLRVASVRAGAGTGRTLYLHRDRLGSVVATTLAGGMPGATYRYGAHGALEGATSDSGDGTSELGYSGALRLSGGLLLMGARVYHPRMRTFLEPDPLEPFNYNYAGGDPVNRVDETGMLEDSHVEPNYQNTPKEPPATPGVDVFCDETGHCYPINEVIPVGGDRDSAAGGGTAGRAREYTLGANDTTRGHSFQRAGMLGDLGRVAGVGATVNVAMRRITGGRFGLREAAAVAAQVLFTVGAMALIPATAPVMAIVAAGSIVGGLGYIVGAVIAGDAVSLPGVLISAAGGALGAFAPALVAASARSATTPLTGFVRSTFEVGWGVESGFATAAALLPAQ